MDKKKWNEKLTSLKKLRAVAEFNKGKAIDDMEELDLMISTMTLKLRSLSKKRK